MACCTTDGSISGSTFGYPNTSHCDVWTPPSGGATMEFGHQYAGMSNLSAVYEHPATWPIEEDNWCRDRILYKGTIIEAKSNKATAGDVIYSEDIGTRVGVPLSSSGFASYTAALNFFPTDISFEPITSDEWFYYLFDTSDHKVGVPCWLLKTVTETQTSTTPEEGTAGQPGYLPAGTDETTTTTTTYIPIDCPCDVETTYISYTTPDDTSQGSARDGYPLLWTAHTTSMSIMFEYTNPPTGPGAKSINGIRVGDTINGWTVAEVKHSSLYFNKYHLINLEGSGQDFTYDGTYTATAGPFWAGAGTQGQQQHVIRVKAGQGIKDKAGLFGRYEFREKEIQYMIGEIRSDFKTGWNYEIREPVLTPTITSGRLTGVTIEFGGSGYENFYPKPKLYVQPPAEYSTDRVKYRPAEIEGIWSGGTLVGVDIKYAGRGYEGGADAPKLGVHTADRIDTKTIWPETKQADNPNTQHWEKISEAMDKESRDIIFGDFKTSELTSLIDWQNEKRTVDVSTDAFTDFVYDTNRNKREHYLEKQKGSAEVLEPIAYNFMQPYISQHFLNNSETNDDASLVKLGNQYKQIEDAFNNNEFEHSVQSITEEKVARYNVQKKYTVIGSFFDLPCATAHRKYVIKQFKNDMRDKITANITLGVTIGDCGGCPEVSGLTGFEWECPCEGGSGSYAEAPTGPPTAGEDGEHPDGTTYTTSRSYTITGPHGPGCSAWEVSASLPIYNNLTATVETYGYALKAFGNPYDFMCPQINTPTVSVPSLQ